MELQYRDARQFLLFEFFSWWLELLLRLTALSDSSIYVWTDVRALAKPRWQTESHQSRFCFLGKGCKLFFMLQAPLQIEAK